MSECACAPSRLYAGRDGLDVVGSVGDSTWYRCSRCGQWLWVLDDGSKFQVFLVWQLDASVAERAARERTVDAVLDLLLVHNAPHGLPYGPSWESPTAVLQAIVQLVPETNSSAVRAALAQRRELPERWRAALNALRAEHASANVHLPDTGYSFSVDERLELDGVELVEETQRGVLLARLEPRCRIIEVSPRGIETRDLPGAARYVGRTGGALLLQAELEAGLSLIRVGGDGVWATSACSRAVRLVAHGGGLHFCSSPTESGARLEVRRQDLTPFAVLDVRGRGPDSYPARPVRSGETWLVPNALVDASHATAFALWHPHEGWGPAASASEQLVTRLTVLGDLVLAVSREQASDRAELWRLSGERIERVASYGGLRSCALLSDVLILETLAIEQNAPVTCLRGMSLDGTQLWESRHVGLASTRVDGQRLIMACGGQALALDARSGRVERELPCDIATLEARDTTATEYHAGRTLRVVRDLEVVAELPLDGEYEVVTTTADAAVLGLGAQLLDTEDADDSAAPRRYRIVSRDGEPRGHFTAVGATWSLEGTVGGPYVVEPDRLRIGRLGSGSAPS